MSCVRKVLFVEGLQLNVIMGCCQRFSDEAVVKDSQMRLFFEITDATLEQFSSRFEQFKKFEDTAKFIKYPDTIDF